MPDRPAQPSASLKRNANGRPEAPAGGLVYAVPRGPGVLRLSPAEHERQVPDLERHCMSNAAALKTILAAQPKPDCALLTPFEVADADFEVGRVVLVFAPQPAFRNHFGNVQGGFGVAMIDVLISIAAYAKTRLWLPTVEIKSSFVAPMKLGECRGEGIVIKAGRQLVFLEAKLWGADGKLAVHATATASVPAQ